jgi:hypothetical protein
MMPLPGDGGAFGLSHFIFYQSSVSYDDRKRISGADLRHTLFLASLDGFCLSGAKDVRGKGGVDVV